MRRILIGSFVVAAAAACTHTSDGAGTTTVTSATVDSAPLELRPELRVASAVCGRMQACAMIGEGATFPTMGDCIRRVGQRAEVQLGAWRCEPAAVRARYEECLASMAEEPCAMIAERSMRSQICRPNATCGL